MKRFLLLFLPVLSLLTGCTTPNSNVSETNSHPDTSETKENTYEQITQIKAKEIMDSGEEYILLDVRTKEEFDDAHIEGAILIPDFEIEERASRQGCPYFSVLPQRTQKQKRRKYPCSAWLYQCKRIWWY